MLQAGGPVQWWLHTGFLQASTSTTEHLLSSRAFECRSSPAYLDSFQLRDGHSAGVPDKSEQPAKTTRIRVERQTHLPATREEAWAALRQLVPPREWQEASGVFAALESIYRSAQHCLTPLPAWLPLQPGTVSAPASPDQQVSERCLSLLLVPGCGICDLVCVCWGGCTTFQSGPQASAVSPVLLSLLALGLGLSQVVGLAGWNTSW